MSRTGLWRAATGLGILAGLLLAAPAAAGAHAASLAPAEACTWREAPIAPVAGKLPSLEAVAAQTATSAWGVGQAIGRPMIEHWDGTAWTAAQDGTGFRHARLTAVTASGTAYAVGASRERPFAERGIGGSWAALPTAPHVQGNTTLEAVAPYANDAVYTGGSVRTAASVEHAVLDRFNGAHWHPVPAPPASELNALTAAGWASVWATALGVQGSSDLSDLEYWNGSTWQDAGSPAGSTTLYRGLAERSRRDVWAVGWKPGTFGSDAVVVHYDGRAWAPVPFELPAQAQGSLLTSVATLADGTIVAAGSWSRDGTFHRTFHPLLETGTPGGLTPVAVPTTIRGSLESVSAVPDGSLIVAAGLHTTVICS